MKTNQQIKFQITLSAKKDINSLVDFIISSVAFLFTKKIALNTLKIKPGSAFFLLSLFAICFLSSCEKNIDLTVKQNKTLLVVEAYINNEITEYNYVVLSHSQDYFSPNFQSLPVSNAKVSITEGTRLPDNSYQWDTASMVDLQEINTPFLPVNFRSGVYFDPRLTINPVLALKGKIGKFYLLQIETEGKQYSAITGLYQPVLIDSLTAGYPYIDDSSISKLRITDHYKDPDTIGNALFYFWRDKDNRNKFGWGGLEKSRAPGLDDLTNGQYIHLTLPPGFDVGDTVNYYMASIPRDVYNFWDTFNKARDNNGPFSTPVTLATTIQGQDVAGCFSGFSMSAKTIIMR